MASALFPLGHHAMDTRAKSDLIPQAPLADESGRSAALKRPCLCAVRELFRPLGDEAPKCAYNSGFRAAVAQLDRVLGYEPRGRGFESCQPRHFFQAPQTPCLRGFFLFGAWFSFISSQAHIGISYIPTWIKVFGSKTLVH